MSSTKKRQTIRTRRYSLSLCMCVFLFFSLSLSLRLSLCASLSLSLSVSHFLSPSLCRCIHACSLFGRYEHFLFARPYYDATPGRWKIFYCNESDATTRTAVATNTGMSSMCVEAICLSAICKPRIGLFFQAFDTVNTNTDAVSHPDHTIILTLFT